MHKLIQGIVDFRERLLPQYVDQFRALAKGQAPDSFLITCADSRVVPELMASTDPGELFVMRNVGNLVPPSTADGISTGDLSEASAIEYAVLELKVQNIIICGHSECGAMKAALAGKPMSETPNLARWLHHITPAVFRLEQEGPLDPKLSRHDQLSQLNVLVQLQHLATYPIVHRGVAKGNLHLVGCWFNIAEGAVCVYERESRVFETIDRSTAERLLNRLRAD
jgi:carbonic anhydrase